MKNIIDYCKIEITKQIKARFYVKYNLDYDNFMKCF